MKRYLIVLFLSIYVYMVRSEEMSSAIPEILQKCYRRNFTVNSRPPLTVPLLVELLRKIEIDPNNYINMRILTTSMFHGVLFDGIQKTNKHHDNDIAIPYRATLNKFYKYKVLADFLIPGQIAQFPRDSLTTSELCFLHTLISNTVDVYERGDEASTCLDNPLMPLEIRNSNSRVSRCPLKYGNIKTRWGTISAGHVIAGITAGVQQNQVTFQRVVEEINTHVNDTVNPHTYVSNYNQVDNVWVATIAGDLAEVVLRQATAKPVIGNDGFWNDTLLPRAFYLESAVWDMTEADILGGIDGVILGKHVKTWLDVLDSTRLSQIINMYYSERGISYDFGINVKNRTSILESLLNTTLLQEQIIGSVRLLQAIGGVYEVTLTHDAITELSSEVAKQFKEVALTLTEKYDTVEYINWPQLKANLEIIIILDGTYNYYQGQQMLYILSEAVQVSHFNSRIGVINGQSGEWMTNVTGHVFDIFRNLSSWDRTWPVTLNLGRSLQRVISHYQNKTNIDCSKRYSKPLGQVLLVFSNDGRLMESDVARTRRAVRSIRNSHPETNIIYLSNDVSGVFNQLVQGDINSALIQPSTDVLSMVTKITEKLKNIPANIFNIYCNEYHEYEVYVTPGIKNLYEIHEEYLKRVQVNTKFINSDYGQLDVCVSTSRSEPHNRICRTLTVNGEISFNSAEFCTLETPCDVQFWVTGNNSRIKCTEDDCIYPDQIRLRILHKYTAKSTCMIPSLSLTFFGSLLILSKYL